MSHFYRYAAVVLCVLSTSAEAAVPGAEKSKSQYSGERARTETVAGWPLLASALGTPVADPTLDRWRGMPPRTAAAEMIGFAGSPMRNWPGRMGSPSRDAYMRAAVAAAFAADRICERVVPEVVVGALTSVESARERARKAFAKVPEAELAQVVGGAIEAGQRAEVADILQSPEVVFMATTAAGGRQDYSHSQAGLVMAQGGSTWFGQEHIGGRKVEFRIQRSTSASRERASDTTITPLPRDMK